MLCLSKNHLCKHVIYLKSTLLAKMLYPHIYGKSLFQGDETMPGVRAARIVPLPGQSCPRPAGEAPNGLPPLLRSYLGLGGWVSDHAVVDTVLDTLHVFTGVEIAKIPPARARALRLIASESVG